MTNIVGHMFFVLKVTCVGTYHLKVGQVVISKCGMFYAEIRDHILFICFIKSLKDMLDSSFATDSLPAPSVFGADSYAS